jgi:hypothetical protein
MPTVRELITRIAFKVEKQRLQAAGTEVGRVKKQMRSMGREVWRLNRSINMMAIGMKAAMVAFVGSRILKVITTDFSKGADQVAKFSQKTGIASDFMQSFAHAAELGGSNSQEAQKAILKLTKTLRTAQQGSKAAVLAFKDIGLDPKTFKVNEDGILQIADAFAGMTDSGKRAAIAQELLGKSGANLIPTLKQGSKAVRGYMDEARRLGIVLSEKQLRDAEAFNDEMLRAKSVFIGVRNQIAVRLLPVLTRAMKDFKEWATEGDNLARALTTVKRAAIAATAAFIALKAVKIGSAFAAALPALKTAVLLLGGVARAAAAAAAPLIVPLALVAAFALAVEDLVRFARGEKSLIGELFGDTAEGQEVKDLLLEIGAVFKGMRQTFKEFNLELLGLFRGLVKTFGRIVKALLPILLRVTIFLLRVVLLVSRLLAWAVDKLVRALNWLLEALSPLGDAFTWLGEKATEAAGAIAGAFGWAADKVSAAWSVVVDGISGAWDWLVEQATAAAKAIASPFQWAWKQIKKGWDFTVGKIIKAVDWIVDKVTDATNALAALAGTQQVGPAGLGAITAAGAKVTQTNQANVRVGGVNVNVQGAPGMTPQELQVAVSKAMGETFSDFANDIIQTRRPVVEGAE